MKIKDFFEHHGIVGNPFAEEDAQTDLVFKSHCIKTTYHPAWDKLFGSPAEPSTSIVFGEKGSGKTALRLQMVRALGEYNADHPDARPLVIEYDDFNPFLDAFRSRFSQRRSPERVLDQFRLWDHLDALLSLGTTQLVDRILYPTEVSYPAAVDSRAIPVEKLSHHQKRDLLGLLVCYDHSRSEEPHVRLGRLMGKMQFRDWKGWFSVYNLLIFGIIGALILLPLFCCGLYWNWFSWAFKAGMFRGVLAVGLLGAGSVVLPLLPYLVFRGRRLFDAIRLKRSVYVINRRSKSIQKLLMEFPKGDYGSLQLPFIRESNNRYELLARFQKILETLGFPGIIVLVDRVDEPYLINGQTQLMKRLLWPILDNKLLQHPGVGLKMLLLDSLLRLIDRESKEFHERCRLDKQNLIRSLDWTGQSLYDLVNARLAACRAGEAMPSIDRFFDERISRQRLLDAFERLKVPRHLFKFLYRLLVVHGSAHTEGDPVWTISSETFEATLAVYLKERDVAEAQFA